MWFSFFKDPHDLLFLDLAILIHMKKAFALLVSILVSLPVLFSQQGYTFNRIGTEDGIGLASNVVFCTYQDAKGFIWVGTANGLQRFDGTKFVQLSSDKNNRSLLVSGLTQILPADSNCLWLSFPNRQEFGLFNTRTLKYTRVPLKVSRPLNARGEYKMWADKHGEVFITVLTYGILHYNKKEKAFTDDNYFHFPPGWTATLGSFEDTVTNRYWFPCDNHGLAVFDANKKVLYTEENNPENIPLLKIRKIKPNTSEFFIDSKRRHWIFNWPDAHYKRCFDSTGKELHDTTGINYNPDYSELRNFFETKSGVLWMYGTNALYNYNNAAKRFYYYDHGFPSSSGIVFQSANQMMEDRDGSIWIATDNGLYFTSSRSASLGVVNRLFEIDHHPVEITDLIELTSGEKWLSTWGNSVITLNRDMNEYDAGIYKNQPSFDATRWIKYRQVWALYQHKDGNVWMGCQSGNYMVYNPETRKTTFSQADVLGKSTIRYITGDKSGNILMGTLRGTLAKYDGKTFSVLQELGSGISKILVDNEGLIWVAPINNGLICLSADGKKIIHHYTSDSKENALFVNNGNDIDQLNDSTIVFGAGALNFISKKTGKVSWLTFDDGLPSNSIERIRKDGNGYLWMITLNGLCCYNPITKRITTYGRKDGITLANKTNEADYFGRDGTVMFAGNNALLYFDPKNFQNKRPEDVIITDFKLLNTYLSVDSVLNLPGIQLNNNQNTFSIYFSTLSYLDREKLTYYYKMTGIDKEWIKVERQNSINYSLLPPGKYNFEVYCENIDGARSKNITSLGIYIKPPFYRTYWFISLVILLVSMGIYLVHRLRVNKLLAVEKLRTRVARDLHDDMGSTLSTINILSSMAKSRINIDPVKTTEYIGKISDNSQRMMDAMDDIVWSIKPSNDTMQKVVARMREFANSVLEAKEIELVLLVDERVLDVKLNMEQRRDLFLVFKEAVNNAAKYSKAEKVTIHIGLHSKRLVMQVADNGVGFDPLIADNGNGLANMQKRAGTLGGRLHIQSREGKGTAVTLNIPVP